MPSQLHRSTEPNGESLPPVTAPCFVYHRVGADSTQLEIPGSRNLCRLGIGGGEAINGAKMYDPDHASVLFL
jgi:hypothetical protein